MIRRSRILRASGSSWRRGALTNFGEGARPGREEHPLFDVNWYVAQLPGPLGQGETPIAHYLRVGEASGLTPHPLFDPRWYVAQLERPLLGETALEHYLRHGAGRGLSPHPLFDASWCARELATDLAVGPHTGLHAKLRAARSSLPDGLDRLRLDRVFSLAESRGIELESLRRKSRKLARDPQAFFADSRWRLLRAIGSLWKSR
jgi:hypothetical protein